MGSDILLNVVAAHPVPFDDTRIYTMTKNSLSVATGLLVAAALICSGAAAATADDEHGNGDVDVTVDIAPIDVPGVLAMSVSASSTVLTENGSGALERRFTGTLPQVTVTDTRTPDEIPAGAAWYVLGTASDFVGAAGQPAIAAANLGWAPRLLDAEGSGEAFAGESVAPARDGGRGLADAELLASTISSADVAAEGSWTASADLILTTGANVAPGVYASTLTLSLFE